MKRLFIIFLSVVMITTTLFIPNMAFADEKGSEDKGSTTPVILVPGVGSSALYQNPNTDTETSPINIDSSFGTTIVQTKIISDVMKIARGKDVDELTFINKLSYLTSSFTSLNCDENGLTQNNIGINCEWTDSLSNHTEYLDSRSTAEPALAKVFCDEIGAENVYMFNYDFRLDVIADADSLSAFIDSVKKNSGYDKVTLVGASLGTSVVSAYIDRYKDKNDINKVIFLDGAFQGTSMGKLFKKDILIEKEAISQYLSLLTQCYVADTMDFSQVEKIINMFDSTVNNVIEYLQTLTSEEYIDAFYLRVILPIVGYMPALWECIPYDDFDECVNEMVKIGWLDTNSDFFKTISEYHAIQGRLQDNLNELMKKDVDVAIVCGYGLPQIPFTSYENAQSDMLIDTHYASFGATVGKAGEMVENATSPDGYINASTCAFEGNTYFVRGVQHMEFVYGTDVNKFVAYLVTTSDKVDVKSVTQSKGYSQYMAIDEDYVMTNVE